MRSQHYTALVYFYDAQYKGLPIRIAAFYQPINEGVSLGWLKFVLRKRSIRGKISLINY